MSMAQGEAKPSLSGKIGNLAFVGTVSGSKQLTREERGTRVVGVESERERGLAVLKFFMYPLMGLDV